MGIKKKTIFCNALLKNWTVFKIWQTAYAYVNTNNQFMRNILFYYLPKTLWNVYKKNPKKEWCFEFLFLLCVTGCVREKWGYSLRLIKGRLALLKLAQMANWHQRFLQQCLQVARRSVWKYITAWFHSKEQLLLTGFIKSHPLNNKQCLSSTSFGRVCLSLVTFSYFSYYKYISHLVIPIS